MPPKKPPTEVKQKNLNVPCPPNLLRDIGICARMSNITIKEFVVNAMQTTTEKYLAGRAK